MKNNPVLVDERPVLLLASASPRRREYIELLGIPYCCEPAEVDETIIGDFDPMEHAEKVAQRKADTVANKHPGRHVLGADTIVVYGDRILGKPKDKADAFRMLTLLQGHAHEVYTGLCLITPEGAEYLDFRCTRVWMAPMSPAQIHSYIATNEPMDKAGSYGIQGRGAAMIERIDGCYFNVVGLPIHGVRMLLHKAGYPIE